MSRWCATSMMHCNLVLTAIVCGLVQAKTHDKNNKWRTNDEVLETIDSIYYDLAVETGDIGNQRKRYISIVSLALSIYMRNDETDDVQGIKDAVARTRKQLKKPADALAGVMRAIIIELRGVIDKPINDIKLSCPPNATQEDCEARLEENHDRNEDTCRGYNKNVVFYDRIVELTQNKHAAEIKDELTHTHRISDEDALNFFTKIASKKHTMFIKQMRDVYREQIGTSYSCNVLNVPMF